MNPGEGGEEGYYGVGGGEVEAVLDYGREKDQADGDYLDEGARLSEPRWFEAAEAGHDVDGGGDGDDQDVAADDGGGYPEGDGQVARGLEDVRHGEEDEGRGHQKLVGDGVDDGAEFGFLLEPAGDEAVKAVRRSGDQEHEQRQSAVSVIEQAGENGNERHAQEGQEIGNCQNAVHPLTP